MKNAVPFLASTVKQFLYYKVLGQKAIEQISPEALHWQYNEESNSIAIIINHLWGNMMSRFTNFLTEDGEKEWRNRDHEFENCQEAKDELMQKWEEGWSCVLECMESLTENDLSKEVFIRNMGHSVMEAISRQLAHYSYHVGQIVYISRMLAGEDWKSLSIPKGKSAAYNAEKFSQEKARKHFTDDYLKE